MHRHLKWCSAILTMICCYGFCKIWAVQYARDAGSMRPTGFIDDRSERPSLHSMWQSTSVSNPPSMCKGWSWENLYCRESYYGSHNSLQDRNTICRTHSSDNEVCFQAGNTLDSRSKRKGGRVEYIAGGNNLELHIAGNKPAPLLVVNHRGNYIFWPVHLRILESLHALVIPNVPNLRRWQCYRS